MSARRSHRFRRRLTSVFVVVVSISTGVVALVTYVAAREYRWRTFTANSVDEASVALAAAPNVLDDARFDRLRAAYEPRTDADLVAVGDEGVFSSSPALSLDDVPPDARVPEKGTPQTFITTVGRRRTMVVAAEGPGDNRYFLFFSLAQLEDSLSELAAISVIGWLLTTALAGAVGQMVARATLRPVAEVAGVAEAIAEGDLDARLPVASSDEFGALAASFNHMADEVQELISELEESTRRLRRFTADVAHELRTPLTGMAATASVLGEMFDDLPPDAKRPAALLVADVRRLRDLVQELLELSRLDAETEPVVPEPLRVRDTVHAVIRSVAGRRDARIDVDVDEDVLVMAEPTRARRIIGNLIDNALAHGGQPVTVTASATGTDTEVVVADRGPGIAPADLPRIFDRFYKSDQSRSTTGSGLGLAIAHQHAVAQGGSLTASNREGGGARFVLRLPAPPRGSGAGTAHSRPQASAATGSSPSAGAGG